MTGAILSPFVTTGLVWYDYAVDSFRSERFDDRFALCFTLWMGMLIVLRKQIGFGLIMAVASMAACIAHLIRPVMSSFDSRKPHSIHVDWDGTTQTETPLEKGMGWSLMNVAGQLQEALGQMRDQRKG